MNQEMFDVSFSFIKAKGLAVGDLFTSDPYLKVWLEPKDGATTKVFMKTRPVFNTCNPIWDVEWNLSSVPLESKFQIEVWDYDATSKDDKIGACEYIFDAKEGEHEISVIYRKKPQGTLTLKVSCKLSDKPGETRWIGPVICETHFSSLAGKIVNHKNDDEMCSYATYKLALPYIGSVFEKLFPWNHDYDNAKAIFAQGVKSSAIQNFLRSQHARLYAHDKTTRYGTIRNGKEFLDLFNNGKRQSVPRYYTYVILEEGMYFSETGASFFTDFMSKHAMHANAAEQVCFAGEFHIQQKDDTCVLVIDNNSGTYAPPKEAVKKLVDLFAFNFPDLSVEAYDRDDTILKDYKKAVNEFKVEVKKSR